MALQKAAGWEVAPKPAWELCQPSPPPHAFILALQRDRWAHCRHLCTLFKCPAGVCGRHQRMWQGSIVGPWRPCGAVCRYRYSPAEPHRPAPAAAADPVAARRRGTAFAVLVRRAAQLAPPELTPTCHPARFSSQQGQKVKKGSERFWPLVTLQP